MSFLWIRRNICMWVKEWEIQRHEVIMSKKNPFKTNNPLFLNTNPLKKFSKKVIISNHIQKKGDLNIFFADFGDSSWEDIQYIFSSITCHIQNKEILFYYLYYKIISVVNKKASKNLSKSKPKTETRTTVKAHTNKD